MRPLYTLTIALLLGTAAQAQTTLWTEDFGTGCNTGQLAGAYSGTNGSWTVVDATSSNNAANKFYVSATEAGIGVGACGDGCLATGGTNATLHVGGVEVVFQTFVLSEVDRGAAYNSGGISQFNFFSTTDITVESPSIPVAGYTDLSVSFNYMEGGDLSLDNATLLYHNGTSWSVLSDLAKTTGCGSGQGLWTAYGATLPEPTSANIKLGFRWVNNDDGAGTDPSFAVDDIVVSGDMTTSIANRADQGPFMIRTFQDGIEVAFSNVDEEIMAMNVFDLLGRSVIERAGNRNSNMWIDTANLHGIFVVRVEATKGQVSRKVVLN